MFELPETLELRGVYHSHKERVELHVAVHTIVKHLKKVYTIAKHLKKVNTVIKGICDIR